MAFISNEYSSGDERGDKTLELVAIWLGQEDLRLKVKERRTDNGQPLSYGGNKSRRNKLWPTVLQPRNWPRVLSLPRRGKW